MMKSKLIDIALIGMDCIFPGAADIETFWSNILSGVDATGDAPDSWNTTPFFDPNAATNDRSYCKRGGYIESLASFDPAQFGIMPGSIDGSDPEHFLALSVASRALADSGYDKREFDRRRTSVIIGYGKLSTTGFMNAAYHASVVDEVLKVARQLRPDLKKNDLESIRTNIKANLLPFTAETCPGITANIVSGRIANRLDLQGPSFTVDAACASSLVALEIAANQLRLGQVDMAIVGGINANLTPTSLVVFSMLGALSRSGRIRPFSAEADGTLLSEGVGMAIVKRLDDARRDNDRIYAVIRGIGSSSDGKGQGLLTPRLEGEALALERAYGFSGIDPSSLGLIEAHGTATTVGDATEVLALSNLFGPRKPPSPTIALGSVKSMIGHTMLAAGMAGMIKTAMALHKKVLPPTLCEKPNQNLGIEKTPMYLNTCSGPWICGNETPRRAGVSAFGFGGINMHVVLEEEPAGPLCGTRQNCGLRTMEICPVSAGSREDLIDRCSKIIVLLNSENSPKIGDLALSLAATTLPDEPWRLAVCAMDNDGLLAGLTLALDKIKKGTNGSFSDRSGVYFQSAPLLPKGKLAVMVPGEGAQYSGMLRETCMEYPKIRQCFEAMDRIFISKGKSPLPSQVVFPAPGIHGPSTTGPDELLWSPEYSLSIVQAANEGLFSIVNDLEIVPDAFVGHSGGQNCALWFAGGMEIDRDTFNTFPLRPSMLGNDTPAATDIRFIVIGCCDPREVYRYVENSDGRLLIAMDNCPNQIVVCGENTVIDRAFQDFSALGAICSAMPFQRPYHTPLYSSKDFQRHDFFDQFKLRPPLIPVYSSTTGHLFPDDPNEIRAQLFNQWVRPVKFRETIEHMYDDGFRIFLDAGPRGNLSGFVNDILSGREQLSIGLDTAALSGPTQIAQTLAQLFVNGARINLFRLHDGLPHSMMSIPWAPAAPGGPLPQGVRKKNLLPPSMKFPTIEIGPVPPMPGPDNAYVNSTPSWKKNGEGRTITGLRRAIWNAPVGMLKPVSSCAAVCIIDSGIEDIGPLAELILGSAEMATFHSLSAGKGRSLEWLCGRMAAKDAVGQLTQTASPLQIEIATEKRGRPYCELDSFGQTGRRRIECSISHAGATAVAVAASRTSNLIGIGVDIELRNRTTTDLEEVGFRESERPLLRPGKSGDSKQTLLKLWCIKEAVAKALGVGIVGNAQAIQIFSFDQSTGIATLTIDASLSDEVFLPVRARAGKEGDFVFAVAAALSRFSKQG